MQEVYEIFRRNFPTIVRRKSIVEDLINDKENKIFERRNKRGKLIAVAIVNKNTIYLLCVDKKYRNQGIGNSLLKECEDFIKQNGYDNIVVGVGMDKRRRCADYCGVFVLISYVRSRNVCGALSDG